MMQLETQTQKEIKRLHNHSKTLWLFSAPLRLCFFAFQYFAFQFSAFQYFALKITRLQALLFIGCMLSSCQQPTTQKSTTWITIPSRNNAARVYRIKTPNHWIAHLPDAHVSLQDTMKAIAEFEIPCEIPEESILITIHNFPSFKPEDRIPPLAQIRRWQRQFDTLAASTVTPQAFSGFVGQLFEGIGTLKGKPTSMMAWTMQLAPEHYLTLLYPTHANQEKYFESIRADIAIKAVGSPESLDTQREAIIQFARTFEIFEELPKRS